MRILMRWRYGFAYETSRTTVDFDADRFWILILAMAIYFLAILDNRTCRKTIKKIR